ncbi:MAG: crossover junction endodeoxyribonuclease RuvC [Planctomycetota bacterium]
MARGVGKSAVAHTAPPRIILGIDPGLDRTGYAVIEFPSTRVLDAGVIRSDATLLLPRRLVEIASGLDEVLAEHTIGLVAVEDLFAHYKHPRTAILMGHARGVALVAAARRGIDVMNILPTRVKKMLTGNGHASKLQMQRAITSTLRLPKIPEPPDVADALAIAWCASMLHRAGERVTDATSKTVTTMNLVRRSRRRLAGVVA